MMDTHFEWLADYLSRLDQDELRDVISRAYDISYRRDGFGAAGYFKHGVVAGLNDIDDKEIGT